MKTCLRILIILCLVYFAGCSQRIVNQPESASNLLIENCEDADNLTLLGGNWYVATDSAKGAGSKASICQKIDGSIVMNGEGYHSKSSFKMSYRLKKGTYTYDPFVVCGFRFLSVDENHPYNASHYDGVSYFFKGPAHLLRIETSQVTDYCYYCYHVTKSDEWKKVTVSFSDLSQPSWGEMVPFSSPSVKGISWQIIGKDTDSSTILIDDISFEISISPMDTIQKNKITIEGDGITMSATLHKPEGDGPFSAVIVLPGGTAASNIGAVFTYHNDFGELFSSKDIVVLVLDYSSEKRRFFDTLQIYDIGCAVNYLKGLPFVQKNRIFLIGFSIGGANALRVGGTRNDIAGLVCYFAPCDWSVSGGGYGVRKQPIEYCKYITCPVLIFQGDSDKVTDVSQSHLLYDTLNAMGKNAELVIYKGAAHGFTYKGAPVGNCVYNENATEDSYVKIENFIDTF